MIPHLKVDSGGTIITNDSVSVTVVRPVNAVSYATIAANDFNGRNYVDNIDLFDTLDIYMDWADATTKVFSGVIEKVGPSSSLAGGFTVTAEARGLGRALLLTHCNAQYGLESSGGIEDPDDIWKDILTNYVEKTFGGAATGYTIADTHINNRTSVPDINFLNSAYRTNFDLIKEVLQIRQANEGHATASDQFFVDTSGNLRIKAIDESQNPGWMRYWRGTTTAESQIIESSHILVSGFNKTAEDFANRIIYCGALRKPAYDYWTENNGLSWGTDDCTDTFDAGGGAREPAAPVVGTYMLKVASGIDGTCYCYYPSTADAAWDFTKIGAVDNPPTLNFQLACDDISDAVQIGVNLFTARGVSYFGYVDSVAASTLQSNLNSDETFQLFSIPIGPYALNPAYTEKYHWTDSNPGVTSWANVNGIEFQFDGTADRDFIFVDDLHFSGKIIRVAYNQTSITAYDEVQAVIVDDTAHDDSMKQADDSGTCALLAKGELMRRQTLPVVGQIKMMRGTETMLPGQIVHVYARKELDGTYKIDSDFRVTKIMHSFDKMGFTSTVDVTSDVLTSFPKSVPNNASIITKYGLMGHRDAKNLKVAGLDVLVEQLVVAYNS